MLFSILSFNFSIPAKLLNLWDSNPNQRNWFNRTIASWNNQEQPKFNKILTQNGIGFTFNMVSPSELLNFDLTTKDFDYFNRDEHINSSLKNTGSNIGQGLRIKLYKPKAKSIHGYCKDSGVSVHSPNEFPQNLMELSFKSDFLVKITPEISQTDGNLRSIPPEERNCYFDGERKLKFFKIYTEENCKAECISFVGYNITGCVPFSLVRNYSMQICELKRMLDRVCNSCF